MTPQEKDLRERMILNARAYSNSIAADYFTDKTTRFILNFTHPLDRIDFSNELQKLKKDDSL